jgi:hypothetical protein
MEDHLARKAMSALGFSVPHDPLSAGYDLLRFETSPSNTCVRVIDGGGEVATGMLNLSGSAIEDLADELLQEWQSEIGVSQADTPFQNRLQQTSSDANEARVTLASAGNYALRSLFDAMDANVAGPAEALIKRRYEDAGMIERPLIFMSDVLFPWRLLYAGPTALRGVIRDDDDPAVVPVRGFLGYECMIDEQALIAPVWRTNRGSAIAAGIHTKLDGRPGGTSDLLRILADRQDLVPSIVHERGPFGDVVASDSAALIYAYCHGEFRRATGGRSLQELVLGRRRIAANYIRRRVRNGPGSLTSAPIAFVNACQGGVRQVERSSTTLEALWECGSQATLGPLVDMPIKFGGPFGVHVIELLLAGKPLAKVLVDATRYFIDSEYNNLLGLAYSSMGGSRATLPNTELA